MRLVANMMPCFRCSYDGRLQQITPPFLLRSDQVQATGAGFAGGANISQQIQSNSISHVPIWQ